MDINQLRQSINSMSPEQLQTFASEAEVRFGINQLLGLPVRRHLLAAAEQLIAERMALLGIKPRAKRLSKPESIVHTIDRRLKPSGRHGRVVIVRRQLSEVL